MEKRKGIDAKLHLNLERFRRSRNIALEQISESTKISSRFLRAIEAEEFDKLPGGVFNINYLRQYAAAIGFEPSQLLAYYNVKMGLQETVAAGNVKPTRWSFSW